MLHAITNGDVPRDELEGVLRDETLFCHFDSSDSTDAVMSAYGVGAATVKAIRMLRQARGSGLDADLLLLLTSLCAGHHHRRRNADAVED